MTSAVTSMAGVGLANVVSKAVTVSKLVQAGGKVAKTLTVAGDMAADATVSVTSCLLYTSPSPRDRQKSRMPSSA